MVLKCGNAPVIDLISGEVFNADLLPVKTWGVQDVYLFLERRVYAQSNRSARMIAQRRDEPSAHKLGLSDSYWVSSDDAVRFEDVSPYFHEFGTLDFVRGFTEPTLRLMGSFDKEWERKAGIICMRKREPALVAKVEVLASGLAAIVGVGDGSPALYGGEFNGIGDVYIRNLSNPDRMLLDFGALLPDKFLNDGFDMSNVQKMYNLVGLPGIVGSYILKVSLFDIITGNGDRRHNQGNWGFYKAVSDGKTSLAPAYDFNLAYSLDLDDGILEQRMRFIRKSHKSAEALHILDSWKQRVYSYCDEYDMAVWRRNFDRLVAGLH